MSKYKILYFSCIVLAILCIVPIITCASLMEQQPWNEVSLTIGVYVSIGVMFAFILVAIGIMMTRSTFRCGKCGMEFKGKPFDIIRGAHTNNKRVMTCPHCGIRGICDHEIK